MTLAIVDCRISAECEIALTKHGYEVIKAPKNTNLPEPMSAHPDMLMFFHKDTLITEADYYNQNRDFFDKITNRKSLRLILTDERAGGVYPTDAIFNALVMGNTLFCKRDSVSHAVLAYASEVGLDIVNVKQGYPACTTLPLCSDIAITADKGMQRALNSCGKTVFLIENGDISLSPYEYGFIGGAAGVADGCVYFLGNTELHKSRDIIMVACKNASVSPVSLSVAPLSDLGRILFI